MPRFLAIIDTPGIKSFVFGTDNLAEIRGGSALLDRLNREQTPDIIKNEFKSAEIVYANGGTGQFIITAPHREDLERVFKKIQECYRYETGGEVCPLFGIAEWPENDSVHYKDVVGQAHEELHLIRNHGSIRYTVPTFPLIVECQSTSHLPASKIDAKDEVEILLSETANRKRQEAYRSRKGQLWQGWLDHIGDKDLQEHSAQLRCRDIQDLVNTDKSKSRYVGLVYADGNSMGRLVQELNSTEISRTFSDIVDSSIREACYATLTSLCSKEIADAQKAVQEQTKPRKLPADILLLGGDDLLVVLPERRTLDFALGVCDKFSELTRNRIEQLTGAQKKYFKDKYLHKSGLTISCGVAIGPASYPFYMLLDLAEELMKNAKRGGSDDPTNKKYWSPSYIDFHRLSGSANQELTRIRLLDYKIDKNYKRTLRPYALTKIQNLRKAVGTLRDVNIPTSKLHDFFQSALENSEAKAQFLIEELFCRLREDKNERSGLWNALEIMGSMDPFPWIKSTSDSKVSRTALADLIEAYELFDYPDQQEEK